MKKLEQTHVLCKMQRKNMRLILFHNFQASILDILPSLLKNIGYEEHRRDNSMTKSLRLLATKWSCKLGHVECNAAATAKLLKKHSSPETK